MHLSHGYLIHPARCMACGNADPQRKVIDFDCDDQGHIRRFHVYACDACIIAAYKMLEPSKVLIETVDLARKEGEITSLTAEVLRLREQADEWDKRIASIVKVDA